MNLFDVYPLFDIEIKKGSGCCVYDAGGQRYLDFYGGHAVISIGHSHPHYLEKLSQQLRQIGFYSNSVKIPVQEELAEKLGRISGYPHYQLFLVNSGAEAIENALKLASFHTGRSKVLCFERAFHGRTSAAVHITDDAALAAPINLGFEREFLPWNDLEAAKQQLSKEDACALIVEGIQGIGGIHVPDGQFLQQLATLCQQHDVVLILDEIQSGFGRTGRFFAHQHAGIEPDLITVAKGMGNGFPIGGVLIHPKFKAKHGLLGTTFGGNHLACAAGAAVLDVIESEGLMENSRKMGELLRASLAGLDGIRELRGQGLMLGVELPFPAAGLRHQLLKEHHIFTGSSSNKNTIRLLPPLTVTEVEIKELTAAFAACLSKHSMPAAAETR
jgi:acetylornithine aminotransferase